jgi:1-acyl-sn-glycerol-3-phosphate acyltransferase
VKTRIARTILRLAGWKIEGARPPHSHYILIAAPHTSNWDFPLMLLFAAAFNIKITWMAKHSLFYPPMGWVMRALGGIPVVRNKNTNVVASMIEAFASAPELVVAVPTEGTRARMDFWKSGFYHIANGAGVPIVPSYLDYGQKRGGFGPALTTSGNISVDMDYLREFYRPMAGKFPERFGPIRLREESDD